MMILCAYIFQNISFDRSIYTVFIYPIRYTYKCIY